MCSHLQVPDNLEEQDIGLYYHSRAGSLTVSDTDISSSVSRPTSQLYLDTTGHSALKSPSQVSEVQQDRQLAVQQPILRSRTLPDLPSTMSVHTESDFAFSAEKVQRMQEWALAFIVGKIDIVFSPRILTSFKFNLTWILDRSCERYTRRCTCPLPRKKICTSL